MNQLYFGDNLEVMQDLSSESIDLVATDPPFNSGRDYNIFLKDSLAQNKAFTDIWKWDKTAKDARTWIEYQSEDNKIYENLNRTLEGYDQIFNHAQSGQLGRTRSYLAFIGPRLAEMHRLLKDTGSLYLHCDPTASHYLKGILDSIFGIENFMNEIIWCYRGGGVPKNAFARKHDIIFFYRKNVKNKDYTFHKQFVPYSQASQDLAKKNGGRTIVGNKLNVERGGQCRTGILI